ncbi:hypothetical protein SDC9_189087 [bioreactor metagenome]|uniref:Uncharacterized protein n=1 Tax=bioreactor metagenome TaxID=1076179 RepID=A0A645HR49_9ZZZZ
MKNLKTGLWTLAANKYESKYFYPIFSVEKIRFTLIFDAIINNLISNRYSGLKNIYIIIIAIEF